MSAKRLDLTGRIFGRLTVLQCAGKNGSGGILWQCECSCGATKIVSRGHLRSGNIASCGCLRREEAALRRAERTGSKNENFRHGQCVGGPSKLYYIWKELIRRCTDPNHPQFKEYGGRGIDVDPKWVRDINAFLADIGPRPRGGYSVDRIDNARGYWPGNVRWATASQQNNNTRANRPIEFDGKTLNLSQWAAHLDAPVSSLHWRLKRGWSVAAALTTPFRRRGAKC